MSIKGWRALAISTVLGAALWAGLMWVLLAAFASEVETVDAPAIVTGCPTEDSCAVDYRDGAYHITPVVP